MLLKLIYPSLRSDTKWTTLCDYGKTRTRKLSNVPQDYHVVKSISIGGSKGGRQGRAPPPGGPNSFIFMRFSAKIINKHTHFGSWRPPLGKILDPPLISIVSLRTSGGIQKAISTKTLSIIQGMIMFMK